MKGAEIAAGAGGVGVAANDELLAFTAFRFDPGFGAALFVYAVGLFGDDAFEPEFAGVFINREAVAFDVIAVAYAVVVERGEQLFEQGFALDQRRFREVVAVEIRQVEGVIEEGC